MNNFIGELYTKGRVEMITLQSIDWIFKKQIENNVLKRKDIEKYLNEIHTKILNDLEEKHYFHPDTKD